MPPLVFSSGKRAGLRFLEFFAAQIRKPHTRRANARAVANLFSWCESIGVTSLPAIQSLYAASWNEMQGRALSAPSVKQQLAAIRHLFDWLVTGQIVPVNPAATVRGARHVVRSGKTAVPEPAGARALLTALTSRRRRDCATGRWSR